MATLAAKHVEQPSLQRLCRAETGRKTSSMKQPISSHWRVLRIRHGWALVIVGLVLELPVRWVVRPDIPYMVPADGLACHAVCERRQPVRYSARG